MRTLFYQELRNYNNIDKADIQDFLVDAMALAEKFEISLEVILEAYKIKEIERQNDLYVENGRAFDAQMLGLGEILKEIISKIQKDANKAKQ